MGVMTHLHGVFTQKSQKDRNIPNTDPVQTVKSGFFFFLFPFNNPIDTPAFSLNPTCWYLKLKKKVVPDLKLHRVMMIDVFSCEKNCVNV